MGKSCEVKSKPKNAKEYFTSSNFRKSAKSAVAGGLLGFLYYTFIGCSSGNCAITSNPFSSVLFGIMLGIFFVNRPCRTC
jgi:urea transporter